LLRELVAHPVVVYRDRMADATAGAVKAATDVNSQV
jgi:hypothetical protein